MQQHPLLQTKLYIPPIRPQLVSRPRLIEQLNAGLTVRGGFSRTRDAFSRALTLVSAPAGFGKTTLVSEWIHKVEAHGDSPLRVAWLSLDEGDNDPARFLAYLLAALRTVEASIGKGVLSALQSPQPPPTEVVLVSLINDVAAIPGSIILVLDDHHTIESSPVDNALTFLLDHLPPNMHLVIATREDPHLPLARLRARGQLTEVRAKDLRFTSDEAAEFLNQAMGLDLSAEDIVALERRTEGWIAGLQLAAISMQGREDTASLVQSFTGSHRYVLDYLVEEVLEQQTERVQAFLLQTAILDRLTGSLCDAVRFGTAETPSSSGGTALTGQDNGQAILDMLDRANLFIVPLDEDRRWYRYHHLFADLLGQRLRRTQPEQVPSLHRRASEWYEQRGFLNEAIEHALRGGYCERAAYLIEDQFGDYYGRGDQTSLRRWLAKIPEEYVFSRPRLCVLHAWNLFSFGQLDAADRRLRVAEEMLDPGIVQELDSSPDKNQLSETERMKLVGRVAAIRSFLASYSGDVPGTIRYARQALEYLPDQELEWRSPALITLGDAHANQGQMVEARKARSEALVTGQASGNASILIIINLRLVEILRQQGELQQVIDICERQLRRADEGGISESVVVGWLLGIWGEVLAELDDLDRAIDQAKKGAKLTARGGDVMHLGSSNLCLVRVLFSSGDITGAEEVIRSMEDIAREYDMPLWILLQLSAWQVRIWLAQGKLEAASQWVGERELDPDGVPTYLHEAEYIVFARILIAQGRLDEATTLLQRLLEAAEAGGRTSKAIEILMLQALALQAQEDTDQAITTLDKALTLAEPGGFVRIFVDEGPSMARLLYEALSRDIFPDYVRRLLAAFPVAEPEQAERASAQTPKSELVEPLSERELEVLELIAEGLTNPEIASRLFLALNTVKAHTRNIYGKLGVHSRTQAVAKAKALGVLTFN
jgi:LuxR family maltose regulon positive regulatory protein